MEIYRVPMAADQGHFSRADRPDYQQFKGLQGVKISVREAARKYDITHQSISNWIKKGFITVLGYEGRKTLIDESAVAYCAYVFKQAPGQGKWPFDKQGNPYRPKGRK